MTTNRSITDLPSDLITPLTPAMIAIRDFADALIFESDSTLDDLQLIADALFDMLDADDRADFDPMHLPAAIDRDALDDDAMRDEYDALARAYAALLDARP